MAVLEFGPTVLGRKIELLTGDHQMNPDLGLSIARRWYDRDGVDAIFDVPNSAIAFGVQGLARQFNRLVVFSSAGSVDLTGKNCDPHSITWTYDTYALARTAATEMTKAGGKSWYFVTADYVFGKQLEADAARFVKAAGGQVLGASRQPINTTDFGQPLVEAQASGAQVLGIANVGLDMVNTVKQAAEFGLTANGKMHAVALFATEQEIAGLGLALGQGMEFATPFYWGMTPAALDWDKRFHAKTKAIPSMNQIGTYEAVLQYLRAVQAAGTTEFEPVRAKLREMRIETPFTRDGWVRDDGRVMRPMHVVRVKPPERSSGRTDVVAPVRTLGAEEAFVPAPESACPLLRKQG